MRMIKILLATLFSLSIASCGGSSSGSVTPPGTGTGTGASYGTPVNLSYNIGTSHLSSAAISGTGATATVIVAWRDDASGSAQIFLARSTDGGATFGLPVNLSNGATGTVPPSARPSVAISGTGATATVLVAWHGQTTNYDVFLARSTDGGATFGAPVAISLNTGSDTWPSVAISGTTVLVAWSGQPADVGGVRIDILMRRSTDGGASFGPAVANLSNRASGNPPDKPSVAISGTTALVAWQDGSLGNFQVFRSLSTDGGVIFGAPVNLSNTSGFSGLPSVAISGSGATAAILIAWEDDAGILVSRSADGGASYGSPVNLSNNFYGYVPSVAISGSGATATVLAAWELNADIYLGRSTDGGASFGATSRLTNNSGFTLTPSVAISGTGATETSVVAWSDDVSGGSDIFLTRSQ